MIFCYDCIEVTTTTEITTTSEIFTTTEPIPSVSNCVTISVTSDLIRADSADGLSVKIKNSFGENYELFFPPPLELGAIKTACYESFVPVVLKSSSNSTKPEIPCESYDDIEITVDLLGNKTDPVNIKLWFKLDCQENEKQYNFDGNDNFWVGKCEENTEVCILCDNCVLNQKQPETTTLATTTTTQIQCKLGYRLTNGTSCVDINECEELSNICSGNLQICENLPGSYRCTCNNGYRMYQSECLDVDECLENLHYCQTDENCVNIAGGFKCYKKYQPVYKPTVAPRFSSGKVLCNSYEQLAYINNIAYCMVNSFNRYYSQPRRLPWNNYNSFSETIPTNQIGNSNTYPIYQMDPSLGRINSSYNNMYVGVPIRLKNWRDSFSYSTGQAFTSTGHFCQIYCQKVFGRTTECKYQFCYV